MTPPAAPPLIVIVNVSEGEKGTDLFTVAGDESVPFSLAALEGGADAIQLRAKGLSGPALVALGRRLAGLCRERGALFFVNDDAAAALACGADGVHVGPGDSAPREARRLLGERGLVGVSVYTAGDLAVAEEAGATYIAAGAVYPTRTKEIAVVGLEGLRRWRARTSLPIVAIGGIDATNAAAAIGAGADGVAVISAVRGAPDPAASVRQLRARVLEALATRQT